jgi:outer membrane protein OmpA-like peptidoglycan-associated protein
MPRLHRRRGGPWRWTVCLLCLALLASPAFSATKADPDLERLQAALDTLDADPVLAQAGGLERLLARQALEALAKARGKARPAALEVAGWRVEAARLAAELEPLVEQSRQLDRDRDAILVEASQREAERARREIELARLRALASEEETERTAAALRREREQAAESARVAAEQAEQARLLAEARAEEAELARKEAELAAQLLAEEEATPAVEPSRLLERLQRKGRTRYVLAGSAFGSGKAALSQPARDALAKLAAELKAGSHPLRVEGHTDSQGNDAANQALSLQRAQAVVAVLQRSGIAAGRLRAQGLGEKEPVADNGSPAGRARNRRVEIVLE